MTRITNFGRKRTYVEAGFNSSGIVEATSVVEASVAEDAKATSKEDDLTTHAPPKKKRKRTKKPKANAGEGAVIGAAPTNNLNSGAVEGGDDQAGDAENTLERRTVEGRLKKVKGKSKQNKDKKSKAASWRAEQSELRRQKRISERQTNTVCFACRKKGHAAKDCPTSVLDDSLEDEAGIKVAPSVGICYRCGSKRHTLSRCKKPADSSDPLPFAACFVCSGKGHLASSCPQNKARGIYPNGGSCKLCGDTTHLAKNCGLMKTDVNASNNPMLFGPAIGIDAGADEDDFHILKRRTAQIEKEGKKEEKAKRTMDIKAGAYSGVVKPFGKPPIASAKKVVYF